jgi:outer membrane protein assembly factor BamB
MPSGSGAEASTMPDLRTRKIGTDWPAFLGPQGDGKSPETTLSLAWRDSGPRVVWHMQTGEGYSAPSISRGRLFLFHRVGDSARLTCMKSETGEKIWQFEYNTDYEDLYGFSNGPRSTPVVDGDRVYIYGVQGILYCIDALDGKVRWQVNTTQEFNVVQNFFGVGSTPIVEENLLIVQIGGSPPNDQKNILSAGGQINSNGTGIVAFDKLTGAVVYTAAEELASYASPVMATIGDRRWGFLFARGGLVGFEPASGKVDFHYPWRASRLESVNVANPVVSGDLVFISESYSLGSSVLRVRPGGYDIVWQDKKRSRSKSMLLHWNTAIQHRGFLYGSSGKSTGGSDIRCIEMATGKVAWMHKTDEHSSLIYVDEHFISIGEHGTLTLLAATPDSANIVARRQMTDKSGSKLLQYPVWAAPVYSNGFLYLLGKHRLVCLDLAE